MKIDTVELYHISMPLQRPFETSMHLERDRECLLIRMEAEGLEGWGECVAPAVPWYSSETTGTAWQIIEQYLAPAVFEADLSGPAEFSSRISGIKGHRMAKASLELALWDLFGKAESKPLFEMLGGARSTVEVGVSIGIQKDVEALLEVVEGHLNEGYLRVKLKIKPGVDLELVEAVRKTHPDLPLQVDANAAYEIEKFDVFEAMDELELLLIEQPYDDAELLAHVELQRRLDTPVCLDESIVSAAQARQALDLEACRIVNIKPGRVGGLTESIAIHDLCLARDVPVWCGGMLETGVGRAANLALATLPGFRFPGDISATDRYYAEDVAAPRFELNSDGTIDVPHGPGLGVEVERDALDRFTLRSTRLEAG